MSKKPIDLGGVIVATALPYTVLSLPIAVQLLEAVARWNPKVVDVLSGVENQEFAISNPLKVGAKFADVRAIPDVLGFLIRERLDHSASITRCVTKVGYGVRASFVPHRRSLQDSLQRHSGSAQSLVRISANGSRPVQISGR